MGDYIKLHRSITDWEWFTNPNTLQVWIYCLTKANWKPGRFQGVEVPRGSFVTSIARISADTRLSARQVRTCLTRLEQTGEIKRKTTKAYTLINVEKYGLFQDAKLESDKQTTNKRQTNDKQTTTIEERKKGRKEKGNNNNPQTPFTSVADRLTDEEWIMLENQFSNEVILLLIDEADEKAKGTVINNPYAYIMGIARNTGEI